MHVFYEDEGSFRVGTILADNNTSLQVETASGKRAKVKAANVLFRFSEPGTHGFMDRAHELAAEMDAEFLWQCCGPDEFSFEILGREYFGREPSPVESAALLVRLHDSPIYFYKKGRGHYKAAPEDALRAALASVERKRQQALLQAQYAEQLGRFELPPALVQALPMLLYRPDRNTIEVKALEAASTATKQAPLRLLEKCGAIPSTRDYHVNRFLYQHFPQGRDHPLPEDLAAHDALPVAEVRAFSIDDVTTTEIDDAFSVTRLAEGWQIGVHIAAPALGVAPGSPVDEVAAKRLSTVYMPGDKITMLPEAVIDAYTLAEGRTAPALSLYLQLRSDLTLLGTSTRLERVPIAANLRLDALDRTFTEEALQAGEIAHSHAREIRLLWEFACVLEAARGRPEQPRPLPMDYSFYVEDDRVRIAERRRGAPIDKLVAELMIFVNTEWGRTLAEHGAPGIYRAQSGGRVKLTTAPAPHDALGVDQYLWASSPLRRYVDLINQRQLLAVLQGAPPPYGKGSEAMLAVLRDFELANDTYYDFQRSMERYWCLRWLLQEKVTRCEATVARENLVKLDPLPLLIKVPSLPDLPPMTRVEVEIGEIDLLDLTVSAQFRARLDQAAA
ncbi:MAG: RNB domain-containing ribonuclease [Betaproteobacteria bacterium]|nr:RNB domain-containing ribonuclease [Betaproteobacteria bacterium]